MTLDWQHRARCRGSDETYPWFGAENERQPQKGEREAEAKAICRACPVRSECLNYALTSGQKWGTWGGLNEDERDREWRKIRRRELRAVS